MPEKPGRFVIRSIMLAWLMCLTAITVGGTPPGSGTSGYQEANGINNANFKAAVWQDADEVLFCVSKDGGGSWSSKQSVPLPSGCNTSYSPSVVIDENDSLIIAFVARSTSLMNSKGGVLVIASNNHGASFKWRSELTAGNNVVSTASPLLAIDNSSGPHRNRIYALWLVSTTRPDKTRWWQLLLAASDNGGKSFSSIPRLRINWDDAEISDTAISVDNRGTVFVVYQQNSQTISKFSGNGGISFHDGP